MRASTLVAALAMSSSILVGPAGAGEWKDPDVTGSIANSAAVDPAARESEASRVAADRSVYESNLTSCVSRSRACSPSALSREDRDYVAYEIVARRQFFDPETVRQVVDVRMGIYGKPLRPIIGQATGQRYVTTAAPSGGSTRTSSDEGISNSQVLGLTRDVARMAGPLIQRLGNGG